MSDRERRARARFDHLLSEERWEDAVRFLAKWLPRDGVVHWNYASLRGLDPELEPGEKEAMAAVRTWIQDPSTEHRARVAELAEEMGYTGSAGWLAAAAGWSGAPKVVPDEVVAQAVTASLMLAATSDGPKEAKDRYRVFAEAGTSVLEARA